MTGNERKDEIARLLSYLPKEIPGDNFTHRVLVAYDQREARPWTLSTTARWSWAVAAILLVVLGFAAGASLRSSGSRSSTQIARSTQLKARHRALEEELERIRDLSAQSAPLLYLGGQENYDLVLDLTSLIDEAMPRDAQPPSMQPASHQPSP